MVFTKDEMDMKIEEFQNRAIKEFEFCHQLYRTATIRLLAAKYHYYVLNTTIMDDIAYDLCESSWYCMGIALGMLKEDETSPCIDFDHKHPLAQEGIALAKILKPRRSK